MSQITTWDNGGYAVITDITGKRIQFYGSPDLHEGELELQKSIKSIHACQFDGKKGLFLIADTGELFFWGTANFIDDFKLKFVKSAIQSLYQIELPPDVKVSDVAVCETNLVLLTDTAELWMSHFAIIATCSAKVTEKHPKNQFYRMLPISSTAKAKQDPIVSIVIGQKFFMVCTRAGRVFAKVMEAPFFGTVFPPVKLANKDLKNSIELRTKGGTNVTASWLCVKFFNQLGRKEQIEQLVANPYTVWARSGSGIVFKISERTEIAGINACCIAATRETHLYWLENKGALKLRYQASADAEATRSELNQVSGCEVLEMMVVNSSEGLPLLAVLKQLGRDELGAGVHRELMIYQDATVHEKIEFPLVESRNMAMPELMASERQIAIWPNGAAAVSLGAMIYIRGDATDREQFSEAYSLGQQQFIQGGFDPTDSHLGRVKSLARADKIFAGHHSTGRAFFILSGRNLLACGRVSPYQLRDSYGAPLVDTRKFALIQLPTIATNVTIEIEDIGMYKNAIIILDREKSKLWLNMPAIERYNFKGKSIVSHINNNEFFEFQLPLDLVPKKFTKDEDCAQAKIVLGETFFYILMPQGYVLEYRGEIVESNPKLKAHYTPLPFSIGQLRIVNFKMPGIVFDSVMRIKQIQMSPDGLAPWFLSTKGGIYTICKGEICQEESTQKKPAILMAVSGTDRIFYVGADQQMYIGSIKSMQVLPNELPGGKGKPEKFLSISIEENTIALAYLSARKTIQMVYIEFPPETGGEPIVNPVTIFRPGEQMSYPCFPALQSGASSADAALLSPVSLVSRFSWDGSPVSPECWSDEEDEIPMQEEGVGAEMEASSLMLPSFTGKTRIISLRGSIR